MTLKINIDPTGRDFFFNPAGNNDFSGLSVENAVADPTQAIVLVGGISPPPGTSDPASINASVSGTYVTGVIIPQFVTCNASSASILTFDAITVQALGRHTVKWGSLLNFTNNGICFKIDGETRVAAEVNACAPIGEDGIGFQVSGLCDEVFIQLRLGDIQGERSIMFDHTANSPTPIQYDVENIEFNADDQTVVRYNDPVGTTATIFNISDVQTRNGGAVAPGSIVAHIIAGVAVIDSDVLAAETIALVESGATLTLDAQALFGNTIIKDGAEAIYKAIGILSGNIEVQGSGQFIANPSFMAGNIDVQLGATLFLDCARLDGDIDIEGTLFVSIDRHTGTITGSGTINGVINGMPFGLHRQKPFEITELSALSLSDQPPLGLDTPLQVEFGASQGSTSDPIELKSNGAILIHKANQYTFRFFIQYGRTGSGGASMLFFKLLIDDVQAGNSIFTKLDGTGDDLPLFVDRTFNLTAGQVVTVEIIRDSQGNDSGGLFATTPTLSDWNTAPSAKVIVSSESLIQALNLIAVLPGSSGDYFSTPDSTAASITSDIDIQMRVSATDWTPSTTETLLSKWDDPSNNKSYLVQLSNTGALRLFLSEDGVITLGPATSSVVTGFIGETLHWVRVTWDQSTGDVDFFTSEDNTDDPSLVSWTALGVTQTLSPSAIFDSTADVEVGSHNTGTINFDGTVSRASIFNGIGGTLSVDFNPQDYRNNSTFISLLTGETWTLNGNVSIEI